MSHQPGLSLVNISRYTGLWLVASWHHIVTPVSSARTVRGQGTISSLSSSRYSEGDVAAPYWSILVNTGLWLVRCSMMKMILAPVSRTWDRWLPPASRQYPLRWLSQKCEATLIYKLHQRQRRNSGALAWNRNIRGDGGTSLCSWWKEDFVAMLKC